MSGRATPLALSILAVSAWAISLAVLLARAELLLVALPGVLETRVGRAYVEITRYDLPGT